LLKDNNGRLLSEAPYLKHVMS